MASAASKFARIVATAFIAGGLCATQALADTNLGTVDGVTYIQESGTVGAAPAEATLTASCLPFSQIVGGGSTPTTSPFSESWLNTNLPADGTDPGTEADGTRGRVANLAGASKGFSTFAICMPVIVRYPSAKTRIDPHHGAKARANCPAGTRVAGGGASLNGPASRSYLNSSYPFDDGDRNSKPDDGWKARAFNNANTRPRLLVVALCVDQRLSYQESDGGPGIRFAPCPVGGHALGGGIEPAGSASAGHIFASFPYADPANPPDRGFILAMGSTSGDGPSYTAHVICTRP